MKHPYKSEADLCDAFVAAVALDGWKAYPECGGFDLLLVKGGVQLGIEAKLRANCDVLAQAIGGTRRPHPQPNHVGVLVPESVMGKWDKSRYRHPGPFLVVASHLNVNVFGHFWIESKVPIHLDPTKTIGIGNIPLPEVAIQTSGGCPSPKVMSEWRVKALKLCILHDEKGWLTSEDFSAAGVSSARWCQYWMKPIGGIMGSKGRRINKYASTGHRDWPSNAYQPEMQALRDKAKETA